MYNISFEHINDTHLERITEIYNYYIKNTTVTYHINEHSKEQMKDILYSDDPRFNSFAIINKDDGKLIGYCLICKFKNREAFDICGEVTVYLEPSCCGKGIGRKALVFLENEARKQNFHTLVASISGDNEMSLKLFEKNGYEKIAHFKEVGVKFGKKLDLIYYEKILM